MGVVFGLNIIIFFSVRLLLKCRKMLVFDGMVPRLFQSAIVNILRHTDVIASDGSAAFTKDSCVEMFQNLLVQRSIGEKKRIA